jgi:hypothetical protein
VGPATGIDVTATVADVAIVVLSVADTTRVVVTTAIGTTVAATAATLATVTATAVAGGRVGVDTGDATTVTATAAVATVVATAPGDGHIGGGLEMLTESGQRIVTGVWRGRGAETARTRTGTRTGAGWGTEIGTTKGRLLDELGQRPQWSTQHPPPSTAAERPCSLATKDSKTRGRR